MELPLLKKPVKRCLVCHVETETDEYGRCRGCRRVYQANRLGLSYRQIQTMPDDFVPFVKTRKASGNERNCKRCGKPFVPTTKNKKYCGQECYQRANTDNARERKRNQTVRHLEDVEGTTVIHNDDGTHDVMKVCIGCGISFVLKHPSQKYHSEQCRKAHLSGQRRSEMGEDICPICGKAYIRKAKNQRYCSSECKRTAQINSYWQEKKIKAAASGANADSGKDE